LCDVGRVAVKHCFKLLSFFTFVYFITVRLSVTTRRSPKGSLKLRLRLLCDARTFAFFCCAFCSLALQPNTLRIAKSETAYWKKRTAWQQLSTPRAAVAGTASQVQAFIAQHAPGRQRAKANDDRSLLISSAIWIWLARNDSSFQLPCSRFICRVSKVDQNIHNSRTVCSKSVSK